MKKKATILKKEKNATPDRLVSPMNQDELEKRIDQSESDFKNNRNKTSAELLAKN